MTIKDMYSTFASNSAPKSSGEFLAALTDRLMERMAPVISQLDEEIDDIESQIIGRPTTGFAVGSAACAVKPLPFG